MRWLGYGIAVLLGVAVLSAGPRAEARLVQIIGYDELFAKADLVVIARPLAKTADTREVTVFEDVATQEPDGRRTPVSAVGEETTFQVVKVIKGRAAATFILHHLREASGNAGGELDVEINGPSLVTFDPANSRDILLFLKREANGRYAPLGGQTDPAGRVIFALDPPP